MVVQFILASRMGHRELESDEEDANAFEVPRDQLSKYISKNNGFKAELQKRNGSNGEQAEKKEEKKEEKDKDKDTDKETQTRHAQRRSERRITHTQRHSNAQNKTQQSTTTYT